MKKVLTLTVLVVSVLFIARAEEGIQFFEGTLSEALNKAKAEKKILFLDCYTTWCGPCKWMAAHVFTNDTVYNYFNKTFVCYKLDMEKGEGIDAARQYKVKNYPTYLWIDATGKQLHRSV